VGSLLLVDDDRLLLESMTEWLRDQDYYVDAVLGCAEAQAQLKVRTYDLILIDVRLQDGDGFDLLEQVRRAYPDTQVMLMTGYGDADAAIEALRAGACDYLTKPLIDDELLMAIERSLTQRQVLEENAELRRELDKQFATGHIVGQDPQMRRLFEMIQSVADTRATILVTGESGTGKSMIARAIHRHSSRSGKPFVEVACGALPENLLESELFGHVQGSFTGANCDKMGKFMQADGGTIFLDEIGTASPAMQVKLLRVLQELEFEQVGGDKTFRVDVRVILATNDDLADAVATGRFRQDLYYRINVISLELPALRQRKTDIPLLAQTFLDQVREDTNRSVTGFSDEALAALEAYSWPGNIRELQNVVERAVLLQPGGRVQVEDLGLRGAGGPGRPGSPASPGGGTLDEILRRALEEALGEAEGNISEAARRLGIGRGRLRSLLRRYGPGRSGPV